MNKHEVTEMAQHLDSCRGPRGEQSCDCGAEQASLAERAARLAYLDGEAAGQAQVIRQVLVAVKHLNPPDSGMGIQELVEWAFSKVWADGYIRGEFLEKSGNPYLVDRGAS